MKTRSSSTANRNQSCAMTLVEVLVVIVVVVVLVICIAPVVDNGAGPKARRAACANNLREIGFAKRLWATDNTNGLPSSFEANQGPATEFAAAVWRHYLATTNELRNLRLLVLVCPADVRKPATNLATLRNQNISYFLSPDADETNPEALLAGDRNLTTNGVAVKPGLLTITSNSVVGFTMEMHVGAGIILLSDGSELQVTSLRLQEQIRNAGLLTNRLVIP
jgi:Tfp pilus assembly protein PilE